MKIPVQQFNESAELVTEAVTDLLSVAVETARHLNERDRPADADQARRVVADVVEGQMRVVVVGEFKSGKSALVNALIGRPLLGADPLASTACPAEVRYGEHVETFVDVERDGDWSSVALLPDEARSITLGGGGRRFGGTVRGVRATVPSPLLASGLTLVDTPSMSGGIASATAGSILAELMQSQAWMLTTDASQELTGPELELIKVGCSLCPVVLVVATKCDLAPEWRRIVEIDQRHLARLDLEIPPVIIPTAAPLRAAAVRLGDRRLDHESGLPLLTWYLTRATTVTARAAAARAATATLVAELEALERAVGDEIDVVLNSGERARILDESRRAQETCERLATLARPTIERATRTFQREVQRDLQDRIEELRRNTMDDLAQLTDEREWPKMEQRTQAGVNRLLAEHLRVIREAIQVAIDTVAEDLTIERGALDVADQMVLPDRSSEHVTSQLDPPVQPTLGVSRLQPALVSARVGATGASGVGVIGVLVGSGAAIASGVLVPIAALGAGWWVRQRNKENEAIPWRRQAEAELNRFLTDCHQLIARCSEDVCDDVLGQLPMLLEQRLRALAQNLTVELERLTALANDRGNMHRAEVELLEGRRNDIRLLASHARRIAHRLDAPVITLPLHVAERTSP